MKINAKQVESVLALPPIERFGHFVKVIADWQEVWGLFENGWALAVANDGTSVFPVWPAKEYAQLCAEGAWKGYEPRSISLVDFSNVLLPKLKADGILPGVFFTPASKGITPSVDELMAALEEELQKY